jgi:hypothetical protein
MLDRSTLPPEIRSLLADDRLNELGPGSANTAVRAQLAELQKTWPASAKVRDRDMALACVAGLWLYHDFLDESHAISQDLHSAEGSYWHAIMHRREPDAWNSKYWWRRVGKHPVFAQLSEQAVKLGWQAWDPAAFVDECEKQRGTGSDRETLLREVARAEWELLFVWCYRHAMG